MEPRDLIGPDGILLLGQALDKQALIAVLVHRLAKLAACDEALLLAAIRKREDLGCTGIGEGVAIPHARLTPVLTPRGVLAVLAQPVDYKAIDDQPVSLVSLLVLPQSRPEIALSALSCMARCLRQPNLRADLRRAGDPSRAYALLCPILQAERSTAP